jgi:hypothetical protein
MTQPQAELFDLDRAGLKTAADLMKTSLDSAERLQNQQLVAMRSAIDQWASLMQEQTRWLGEASAATTPGKAEQKKSG